MRATSVSPVARAVKPKILITRFQVFDTVALERLGGRTARLVERSNKALAGGDTRLHLIESHLENPVAWK